MKAAFEAISWALFCLYAWRINKKYQWFEEANLIGFWDAMVEVSRKDPSSARWSVTPRTRRNFNESI